MLHYDFYIKYDPYDGLARTTDFTSGSDHIWYDMEWHQVYPGIDHDAGIEYEIEKYRVRRKFSGSLWFVNKVQNDYDAINEIDAASAQFKIRIQQTSGATVASDFWTGYFSVIDGDWDNDRGIYKVTPSVHDGYREILEEGDRQFNLADLNGGESVQIDLPSEEYLVITNYMASWMTPAIYQALYHPNGIWKPGHANADTQVWSLYTEDPVFTVTEANRIYNDLDYGLMYDIDPDKYGGSKRFIWRKEYFSIDPNDVSYIDELAGGYNTDQIWSTPASDTQYITTSLTNGRGILLKDVIKYMVRTLTQSEFKLVPDDPMYYRSTFFENDAIPTIGSDWWQVTHVPYDVSTYFDQVTTENYVTGTDPNPLNGMVIIPKSEIFPASNKCTKAMISFNELMDILQKMFNVYWYIDPDGYFRIEHRSWFELQPVDTDLTTMDGGKWIKSLYKYNYEKPDMPSREHFEFMEAGTRVYDYSDFIGYDIIYDRVATFNRYEDNQLDRIVPVTTDVSFALNEPSMISNDGWVIMTVTDGSDILYDTGIISGISQPNCHLSWANLHNNYWTYGRVLIEANMNGSDVVFTDFPWGGSNERYIRQVDITYPSLTIDPMKLKKTQIGDGEPREIFYKLLDGTVKVGFFLT